MLLHKLNVSMMMALTYIVLGCDQIKKGKLLNLGSIWFLYPLQT